MQFLRNNAYWMLSIVIVIGIGSIIAMHRVQQQVSEPEHGMPDVAEQTQETSKRPIRAAPHPTSRKTLKTIGPGHAGHNHPETPPPLPTDALKRREIMIRERVDVGKDIWDWRDDGPHLTVEASQIELEALTDGMTPEDAIDFLEQHGQYNEAILSQVSAHRAFKYLQAIRASWEKVNEYAEKALVENPDNFEAKMKLMLSEKDNAKAAAGYREILAKDPNHVGALLNLGYRTHYDNPESALEHLIKGNKLDPTRGFRAIGLVYERLGNVKTAWLYYRKHLTLWPRDILAGSHLSWIEIGQPKYTPIYLERQPVQSRDEVSMDNGAVIPKEKRTPTVEDMPWFPELPPDETHLSENRPTDVEAARAEFERRQAAAQKEFDAFIKWAESVMHEDFPIDTNDFLTKELAAHLKGGKTEVAPERLVRAFELMERHGRTSGLQRLKDKDPELAAKVVRFHEEKQ